MSIIGGVLHSHHCKSSSRTVVCLSLYTWNNSTNSKTNFN